jgi:hypothetical protein
MPDPDSLFFDVSLRTWMMAAAVIVLLAMAHVILLWWAHRRARDSKASETGSPVPPRKRHWVARGLRDAVSPIAFFLWL